MVRGYKLPQILKKLMISENILSAPSPHHHHGHHHTTIIMEMEGKKKKKTDTQSQDVTKTKSHCRKCLFYRAVKNRKRYANKANIVKTILLSSFNFVSRYGLWSKLKLKLKLFKLYAPREYREKKKQKQKKVFHILTIEFGVLLFERKMLKYVNDMHNQFVWDEEREWMAEINHKKKVKLLHVTTKMLIISNAKFSKRTERNGRKSIYKHIYRIACIA